MSDPANVVLRGQRVLDRAAPWPPPPTDADQQRTVIVTDPDCRGRRVVGREVTLWRQRVVIDDVGRVFCPCCRAFVTLDELVHPHNPHAVGLPRVPGALAASPDDRSRGRWAGRSLVAYIPGRR